jgi:hypothetical protein
MKQQVSGMLFSFTGRDEIFSCSNDPCFWLQERALAWAISYYH